MKTPWKIAVLLPLAALCLKGCIKPEKEVLTVDAYRIQVPALQPTPVPLVIAANCMWTIETTDTWFNVTPTKAYGDKTIEISVSPNTSLDTRRARFYIAGTSIRQEVEVVQLGEEPTITLKINPITAQPAGGEVEVEVSTNVELELGIDVPWVKFVSTKTISSSVYCFQVEKNTDLESRSAKVTFKQKGGSINKILTINQLGEAPVVVLSKASITVGAEGGDHFVALSANVSWKASCMEDWVMVTDPPSTKLVENDVCYFYVKPNPRVENREAVLIFTGTGAEPEFLSIYQDGTGASASFVPTQYLNISPVASTNKYKIEVSANFNWTVDFSKTSSWVKDVTFDANSCSFHAEANPDVVGRATTIVFKQTGVPDSKAYTYEYTISQSSAAVQLYFAPVQSEIKELSGGIDSTLLVLVTANVPWTHQVDQPWLKFEERYVNNLPVNTKAYRVTAQENTATDVRTANIRLVSQSLTRTIVITQKEGLPRLSVSPRRIEAPAQGASQVITINTNIIWTRSNAANWVTVGPAPATKNPLKDTMLLVSVSPNTSFNSRKETVYIRQRDGNLVDSVVITQTGVQPSISFIPSKPAASGAGEDFTLTINANYSVTLVTPTESWLTLKESVPNLRYTFTVKPTNSGIPRTAIILFRDVNGVEPDRGYTLVQKGATVSVADSLALEKLYRATTGVVWRNKWDLNQPVFNWHGVTLSGDIRDGELRVTELDLSGEGLIGLLVGGIQVSKVPLEDLRDLTKLNLSGNYGLAGVLPVDLCKLSLRELDLSNCSFSNAADGTNIPEEWGKTNSSSVNLYFTNLERFRVFGNLLNGAIPLSIQNHVRFGDWDWQTNLKPQRLGNELGL